jgi:hypothetical protein
MAFLKKHPLEWTQKDWNQYLLVMSGFWFWDQCYGAALHTLFKDSKEPRSVD